jgi:hypothetical protein
VSETISSTQSRRRSDTLESVARSDLSGTLKHGFTAHPKIDRVTGELHAVTYVPPEIESNAKGKPRLWDQWIQPEAPSLEGRAGQAGPLLGA